MAIDSSKRRYGKFVSCTASRTTSRVQSEYMFKPQVEATYSPAAARYHLIGSETTPCYGVKQSVIKGVVEREDESFFIGVVTSGRCRLVTEQHAIELETYDKFFCPAGLGTYRIEANDEPSDESNGDGEVRILECFPPSAE